MTSIGCGQKNSVIDPLFTQEKIMTDFTKDRFTLGDASVARMGYGAMQLAGPHVFGPPKDPQACAAVLREVVASGINHIDTSDFYGPHVVNQLIRETLHPYAKDLVIVSKVGARRDAKGGWLHDLSAKGLRSSVEDNLRNLGLAQLFAVNLRISDEVRDGSASIAAPFQVLVDLQKAGKIRHLGLSNVTAAHLAEAQKLAPVVCVQNHYNVAHREDDALVDACAKQGIAFVPFFPLGGFSPLQSSTLNDVATELKATPMQVALAWLLHRSPAMLLIPGTSSLAHLRENMGAAALALPQAAMSRLDQIATKGG
jgi:aryl-alcohol dehydrogenase-like predicted oxidoreductase